jgi:tetratricopeptide (TPR) repeat protein
MWMHLGDLTGEIEHYEHAWTLSKQHLARAKLKLGSNAMRLEQWEEARTHLSDALGARSHYAEAWYCRAVCSLKLNALDTALADMRKVITLDPTHYQAWSSLGGLFARQKMKREALYAFRQACALRSDNWQLWQHAALAALDVGLFEESIFSAGRSLSLNGPPAPQISSLISQAVAKDIKGTDGRCARRSCPRRASCLHVLTTAPARALSLSLPHRYARRLLPKARELLANSASAQPNEPVHWEARLHLEKQCGSTKEVRLAPPTLAYPRLPPYPRPTPPASLALALGHGSAAAASRHEPRG